MDTPTRTSRLLAIVLAVTVLLTTTGPASDASPGQPAPVAFVGLPDDFQSMAKWAIERFDQAGLELPPLRFVYHEGDRTPCLGRDGLHHSVDDVNIIEICATDPSFPIRVMILHETAHAWVHHSLTPERKAAFRELRGWEHWRNYGEAAWHENGTEQAAEIMVWGLIDRPIRIVRILQNDCDQLDTGYRTLTTSEPLNRFRDFCTN
jgi:hypothetical protein